MRMEPNCDHSQRATSVLITYIGILIRFVRHFIGRGSLSAPD
jgi:hypothetical protein